MQTTSYVLANGRLISQTQGATTSYYLADAQGSTRALTDSSGALLNTYDYAAFGDLVAQTGTTSNDYLYTGQRYDATTEQYYLRAREYDPVVGRFLSRDTWAVDTWNPVEVNRYGYAAGNPVTFVDPSGYMAIETGIQYENEGTSTIVGSIEVQQGLISAEGAEGIGIVAKEALTEFVAEQVSVAIAQGVPSAAITSVAASNTGALFKVTVLVVVSTMLLTASQPSSEPDVNDNNRRKTCATEFPGLRICAANYKDSMMGACNEVAEIFGEIGIQVSVRNFAISNLGKETCGKCWQFSFSNHGQRGGKYYPLEEHTHFNIYLNEQAFYARKEPCAAVWHGPCCSENNGEPIREWKYWTEHLRPECAS